MKRDYTFTFVRHNAGEMQDRKEDIPAHSFDEAVTMATAFCDIHECRISYVEWFDEELQLWQRSAVSYT